MIKLLSYLKPHIKEVVLIFLLMMVQVYCDLTLPQYTSDIVNVGIQQAGIEDCVPDKISGESYALLSAQLRKGDRELLEASYTPDGQGVYEYSGDDREALAAALAVPEAKLLGLDDYSGSMAEQAAVTFVAGEYQKLGVDMEKLQMSYLLREGAYMLIFTVIMVIAAIITGYFAARVGSSVGRDARKGIFEKVLSFGYKEMNRFQTASLITRSTNDVQQIQNTIIMLLRVVMMAPIMGVGACIKVVSTRTGMGWITVCAVVIICIVLLTILVVTMPKFKVMQRLIDRINLVSREIITGTPVIRAFSREDYEKKRFDSASRDLMKTQLFTQRAMSIMTPALMIIMNLVVLVIVWFGARGVDLGRLQVGDMIAFITYTMQVVSSFMWLTMAAIFLPRANVAAERIREVMDAEPSVSNKAETVSLPDARGVIRFENVDFRFPGAEKNALSGISFTAVPGETTAVIGSTGSGKSTLLDLIPRFYDVSGGRITIDGTDIEDMDLKELRSMIGYVPQKGMLFNGDIRSNIKFASDDISDEAMEEAAEIACATEIVGEREEGYDSYVAQSGTNLSGGQKQRLSIARAIAKDPLIYLFDDCFSALDYRTDSQVRKALKEKTKEKTVIIVAQRIATILHADRIIVLDNGRIAGTGTHEELLAGCGVYREIAESQLSAAELKGGEADGEND